MESNKGNVVPMQQEPTGSLPLSLIYDISDMLAIRRRELINEIQMIDAKLAQLRSAAPAPGNS